MLGLHGNFAGCCGNLFLGLFFILFFLSLLSQMLMSVRGNPVLMLTLAKISLVDITVTAFRDGQELIVISVSISLVSMLTVGCFFLKKRCLW